MTVEIGQLLKLLDMIPDKKGRRTFIEKLPSAQKLDGGNLSGLMGMMQSGGLQSLFRNPLSVVSGPLQDLLGAVQAGGGSNPFTAAIGGLSGAVQNISSLAARLSGTVGGSAGLFGFTDLALHESVLDQIGNSAPASMALSVASAPLTAGDLLSRVATTVYQYNTAIAQGQMSPSDAAPDIISFTAQISAIVSSSNSALSQGEAMAPGIAQVQTAAGMLASGSPELQKLIRMCLQPSVAAVMDDALKDRLTIRPPDSTS